MDEFYLSLGKSNSLENIGKDVVYDVVYDVNNILDIGVYNEEKKYILEEEFIFNRRRVEVVNKNTKKLEEDVEKFASDEIFSCCEKIKKIVNSPNFKFEQLSKETKKSINSLIEELKISSEIIVETPDLSKNENVVFDDLGLPLHPLEVEVLNLVERAKKGEQVFPKYSRSVDGGVLDYLQKYYGIYLKAFNNEDDYIYQFHLGEIDSKFRQNLKNWLMRNGDDINNYVPKKSKQLDKKASEIKDNPSIKNVKMTDSVAKLSKLNSLRLTNRI